MLSLETVERDQDLANLLDYHLSWLASPLLTMIVLTYNIVGVHHGHHLLILKPGLFLPCLVIMVKVVFLEAEGFGAEGHKTEDENYHNEDTEEDNEDDGEGMEVRGS